MPKKQPNYPKLNDNELVFFQSSDGRIHVEVMYGEENVWLSQKSMAMLFDTTPQNITMHLKNIYNKNELDKNATCKDFLQVQKSNYRGILDNSQFTIYHSQL